MSILAMPGNVRFACSEPNVPTGKIISALELPSCEVHSGAKIPVGSRHNLIQLTEPGD